MVVVGAVVGGIVGFGVALLITEVIIGNAATGSGFDWQFWTDVVLTVIGVLVGLTVARRYIAQRSAPTT